MIPYLQPFFVLCFEYMALLLRQSRLRKGLVIDKHCFKVSLFADDTVVFLNSNLSQFKHVFDILDVFSDQSRCKVNMNKSNAFYIGSRRKTIFKPFSTDDLTWQTNTIKYLGVNIPINHGDNISFVNENCLPILNETKSILNIWTSRGLTLLGKITISMVTPKLVYKTSNLPVTSSDSFIKQVNQSLFRFIWGSKWEKMRRSQLCCDIEEGGAKMIDIKQHILALQFKGVVRSFDNNYTSSWKTLKNLCLTENLFFCVLRSNVKLTNMMIAKLAFLCFTRSTLSTLKSVVNASEIPPGNKFLWLNKNVKYQNKPLFI